MEEHLKKLTSSMDETKETILLPLYRTTIVIWSAYDPVGMSLEQLGYEADQGDSYCSKQEKVLVDDPASDPAWDGNDFFNDFDHGD